ncbi:MAG: valine--tRNA ligase [Deltaproteobacteria bacterium]|nr:valine--tRNA ligase [Deltaproteobacteria bacterium]MBW1919398.1 valine--tRNA ligase [Deltaproteobacteria bacterium]MBW1934483.1 valine--tRNA ligase [Deltaproteobacteria bacterium]MBW1979139.1 valine--tRNA ligase [Deltaproteobacteria bacterium]MBW2045966.1 valine--tRNA ligase [Deltaproteobacteria bacterium]
MHDEAISKSYEPKEVEEKWYKYWEEKGLFKPEPKSEKPPYCIVIPPPNVTGSLHMGHALNNTLQDILCRFKRMKGFNVLWQPGTDHAGIATQNVVEKALAKEGLDRHKIGREKFIERVWEWKEKYGGLIINQLKRLGSSCDWSRERFTMDEGLSRAVREVFVRLYEKKLIYRGDYIINWCPRCRTALADLEVEHAEMDSFLYYIKYPFEGREGHLTVATTRPETLLGDTAVAVNPEDERYTNLSGAQVILPILNKVIPVIYDRYVDREFGTGALKITPAHDPHDFEIGNAHGLDRIRVIAEDGKMNEHAGPYQGMDRFECREKIVEDLKKAGLLEKIEPYRNAIGHCYRCKTMIEPLLSKQWFVKITPLAEKAIAAVRKGDTTIIPSSWAGVYFEWMNNIKDWCISRQIWWGHRIPAWYCQNCGEIVVAREEPAECSSCHSKELLQESDVLDTWFSSALWPFSTLGWPDDTEELRTFYPTSAMVTGFDILFFWVARMMMMGLEFMGDVPFREVYIHALVRDEHGKKMSKSKGNVIDPLEVLDEYGTDAFRFTLAALAAQGRDIKLSEERISGYRHFVNKLWNSARFAMMNLDDSVEIEAQGREYTLAERWILTRLSEVSEQISTALEEYRFNDAASMGYQFVWHEFCDWYLEMAKLSLYGNNEEAKRTSRMVLQSTLAAVLKLLHPFMPFVTEEIWQRLPGTEGSIMVAKFPQASDFQVDLDALSEMDLIMGVTTGIRNIRGEMNISPSKKVDVVIEAPEERDADRIRKNFAYIQNLAKVDSIAVEHRVQKPEASATCVLGHNQVHVLLKGLLDFEEEKKRLKKAIGKIEKDMASAQNKLSNKRFMERAPAEVVEKVKAKVDSMRLQLDKLNQNLAFFESIND